MASDGVSAVAYRQLPVVAWPTTVVAHEPVDDRAMNRTSPPTSKEPLHALAIRAVPSSGSKAAEDDSQSPPVVPIPATCWVRQAAPVHFDQSTSSLRLCT